MSKRKVQRDIVLLRNEVLEFFSFFLGQIGIVESFVGQEMPEKKLIGLRSLALSKMFFYQQQLQSLKKMWSDVVVVPVPDRKIVSFELATPSESVAGVIEVHDVEFDENAVLLCLLAALVGDAGAPWKMR